MASKKRKAEVTREDGKNELSLPTKRPGKRQKQKRTDVKAKEDPQRIVFGELDIDRIFALRNIVRATIIENGLPLPEWKVGDIVAGTETVRKLKAQNAAIPPEFQKYEKYCTLLTL